MAGWSRSAEFELALDGWAEFGLSRFSASRGLDELERAGLVSVGRTPGRSPGVTILDATVAKDWYYWDGWPCRVLVSESGQL